MTGVATFSAVYCGVHKRRDANSFDRVASRMVCGTRRGRCADKTSLKTRSGRAPEPCVVRRFRAISQARATSAAERSLAASGEKINGCSHRTGPPALAGPRFLPQFCMLLACQDFGSLSLCHANQWTRYAWSVYRKCLGWWYIIRLKQYNKICLCWYVTIC